MCNVITKQNNVKLGLNGKNDAKDHAVILTVTVFHWLFKYIVIIMIDFIIDYRYNYDCTFYCYCKKLQREI